MNHAFGRPCLTAGKQAQINADKKGPEIGIKRRREMKEAIGGAVSRLVMFSIPVLFVFGAIFFIFSGKRTKFEID